jgi:hypothetical protein
LKTKKEIENEIKWFKKGIDLRYSSSEAEIMIDCLRWVLSEKPKKQKLFEGLQDDLFDKKKTVKKYYKD